MRSRSDSSARSTCGRTISAKIQSSAGSSSSASIRRRCAARVANSSGTGGRGAARGKAGRALRVEAEIHALADFQIGEPAGLRQGDTKLEPTALLGEQHRRVGAVEEEALHLADVVGLLTRQPLGLALEGRDFGTHERLDGITD